MGGFRDPNEALRARADALEARVEAQERALREKDAEIARLAASQVNARDTADENARARAERARVRHESRKLRRSTPPGGVPTKPIDPRAEARPSPTRGALVGASLAVALGAVALAGSPFAWVLTQPVAAGDGWSGVLFAGAFLAAVGGILQLPSVCFGFLATGAEGVVSDGANGETRTFRHNLPRARRALRWLGVWCAVLALCCVLMPRLA